MMIYSGTTPFFKNTSITQINEPHSLQIVFSNEFPVIEPLPCWSVELDDIPLKAMRPA